MSLRPVLIVVVLLSSLFGPVPLAHGQAAAPGFLTIEKVVLGNPSPTDFSFDITPSTPGCPAPPTVVVPGAGGFGQASVALVTTGPFTFDASDFVVAPSFSDVETFSFAIDLPGVAPGLTYNDPPISAINYNVSGNLGAGTASGFAAFDLVRSITGRDFDAQGSSISFAVDPGADLSDGLQVAELSGPDPVFVLNAREVDTGRYHPPLLELNADGTGRIQNSNNMGGVNPATGMVVNVDFGDEYISDLSFDPAALTLADPVACRYSITELPTAGYTPLVETFEDVPPLSVVRFFNVEDASNPCRTELVTIDMNTNGGDGIGTPGADVILGTPGADTIDGRGGRDTICAGRGDDIIQGGPGNDLIYGQQGSDTIDGGLGVDKIFGQGGADTISGGDGDDAVRGGADNDALRGDAGNDRIFGNSGSDRAFGGPGDDRLRGQASADQLFGQTGNDLIVGGGGLDIHDGGPGRDRCLEGANQSLTETYISCELP